MPNRTFNPAIADPRGRVGFLPDQPATAWIPTGLALLFLVIIGVVSIGSTLQSTRDADEAQHSQKVLTKLGTLYSTFQDNETGMQSYIITGDEQFIIPSRHSHERNTEIFGSLRQLTADSPVQQRRLDLLEPLIAKRSLVVAENIEERKARGFAAAQERVQSGTGSVLIGEIRHMIGELEKAELLLLDQRKTQFKTSSRYALAIIVFGSILAVGLISGALWIIHRDFRRHQRMDEAVRQSDLRFQRLVDENMIGVMVTRCDCVYEANDYFLNLLQYSREELEKGLLHWDKIVPPEYLPIDRKTPDDESHEHGACAPLEKECLRKDGSRVPVLIGYSIIAHDPMTRICFVLDQSERKRSEDRLRENEARFRSIFNEAAVGMAVTTLDGRYSQVNSAFCNLLGYSEAELRGTAYESLTHPEDREATGIDSRQRLLDGDLPVFRTEKRYLHHSGRVVWVIVNVSTVRNALNQPLYFIAQFQDITQRKRAEDEIRNLNESLERRVFRRTMELSLANTELNEEMATCRRLEKIVLEISEREQNRIGQDLHDDLGQQLTGLAMLTKGLERRLCKEAHPEAANVDELARLLSNSIGMVRDLAKGLYPVELERGGLLCALRELADRTERLSQVSCTLNHDALFSFKLASAIHLYRIVQEAINNAIKHAAASNIVIECTHQNGVSVLSVSNDGAAFEEPASGLRGMGLDLMRYRAGMIGARLEIKKGETGGCIVICRMRI